MESQQGVFKSGGENITCADVKDAIANIDAVLAGTFVSAKQVVIYLKIKLKGKILQTKIKIDITYNQYDEVLSLGLFLLLKMPDPINQN